MKEQDDITQLFDRHRGQFDLAQPEQGHLERFRSRLHPDEEEEPRVHTLHSWKWMGIAASILILVAVLLFPQGGAAEKTELASISPEMAETESFFKLAIEKELFTLQESENPQTQQLIEDTIEQLDLLEKDYDRMKEDLADSGEDKRVIFAMITNLQSRVDLLKSVLEQIEEVKQINNTNDYENSVL
ncbi:hypothetical protein [Croceiramulus getboli]|nr:hypothetical protein P8624_11185 [Flavobacteriaceae bacterium YJPT1-3]